MEKKSEILKLTDDVHCTSIALNICLKDEYKKNPKLINLALLSIIQHHQTKKLLELIKEIV